MISGDKIKIKGLTKNSQEKIYAWVNDEELRKLTGTIYPISEFEHEEWIKNVATSKEYKVFMISEKEKNLDIGTIGLKNFDYLNSNVELFISIGNRNYLNGGYGADAVRTMTRYVFNRLNLHKVYLKVFESNKRAIRCYEKVGFKKEGILKDHCFIEGKYENVIVMGILK